jgi:hypothetical protein
LEKDARRNSRLAGIVGCSYVVFLMGFLENLWHYQIKTRRMRTDDKPDRKENSGVKDKK